MSTYQATIPAGDLVQLLPSQQLVMEVHQQSTDKNTFTPMYFSWESDAATSKVTLSLRARGARCDLQKSLRDLGEALHQAGGALGRLAQGVAGNLACTLVSRMTKSRPQASIHMRISPATLGTKLMARPALDLKQPTATAVTWLLACCEQIRLVKWGSLWHMVFFQKAHPN